MSNVTGQNLDLVRMFLNLLNSRVEYISTEPAEFQIDDIYSVPGNNNSLMNIKRQIKKNFFSYYRSWNSGWHKKNFETFMFLNN